jgi:anti-sigma factor RsiW
MSAAIASDLTCKEFVELLTDYFEDRLTGETDARFEVHVFGCAGCRVYLAQMRALVRAAGRLAETDLPAAVRDDLLRTFRERKRA